LPTVAAHEATEDEDCLLKHGDANWNPEKHPRTGTPPNPICRRISSY
jgi:hypothetical protein